MTTGALEQRIRILPESVINQIAAGEVVLRPASVIKELGENAIDAEATTLTFWTEQGGKTFIQVTDDGIGMSAVDAELCFERHATSKIVSARDLYALTTRGFRGEALASIAAVAEVELFTRRQQDPIGTRVLMAFGEKKQVEPARCAVGTTLIVRRLFHRLPVRRKSLRTVATEHRHNIEEFLRLAYPYPDRYFRFYHDGALLYDLPPAFPLQRILALNPSLAESALLPVEEDTSFFQVRGFLVLPEKVPAGNRENYLFINRRYIRQGLLQQAIYQLYKPLLSGETRPLYWLFLYIPPEQVDVNVTPSKTEARLLYELEIRSMLVSVLRKALAVSQFFLPSEWSHRPTLEMDSEPVPKQVEEKEASFPRLFGEVPEPSPSPRAEQYVVLYGRYLLVSQEKEVWVVDVQGAHERLLYERHVRGGTVASQGLLFPAHMPISAWQGEHLREMESALREQGFHVEVREGREAVLHAIPAGLSPSAGGALLKELLALVAGEELPVDWRERLAQHIARYGSPRPPYKLTPEVVERLWADLMACTEPNYSPSGRRIRYLLRESTVEGFFS